jgi:hypothetical protein
MPAEWTLTLNSRKYLGEFQAALGDSIGELRNTLRSIEEGSFLRRARQAQSGWIVRLEFQPSGSAAPEAKGDACNRCFLDLTRALLSFLDRMLAIRRCAQQRITLSEPIQTQDELNALVDGLVDAQYAEVSRDRRLSNPKKLAEFAGIPEFAKKALQSYFDLRNCLEHHGGVPTADLPVHSMKLTLLAGDQEITAMPFTAEAGVSVNIRSDVVVFVFPANARVAMTEAQVEGILLTLQQWAGPAILGAL